MFPITVNIHWSDGTTEPVRLTGPIETPAASSLKYCERYDIMRPMHSHWDRGTWARRIAAYKCAQEADRLLRQRGYVPPWEEADRNVIARTRDSGVEEERNVDAVRMSSSTGV